MDITKMYWVNATGEKYEVVFECDDFELRAIAPSCRAEIFIPETDLYIRIWTSPRALPEWRWMLQMTLQLMEHWRVPDEAPH